jgi:hypothetical protein
LIKDKIKVKDRNLLPQTEEFEKRWNEWYNDFEDMYPISSEMRHKELKETYPEMYE